MFGYGANHWQELAEHCPDLEGERCQLESALKERVQVSRVMALRLDNGREQASADK
jgi:hypothetical protein